MSIMIRFSVILSLLMVFQVSAQDVVINEILASNGSVNSDGDGDYEDWIELYNAGNTTVGLGNYGLSDTWEDPFRWVMPQVELAPGDFLLIWASGKDHRDPQNELHTNFSISAQGEEVLLTNPQGDLVDAFEAVALPRDISYGRQPDGSDNLVYFTEPTPGTSNTTQGYETVLPAPVFSTPAGFFNDPFYLEITSTEPGATIYYTLDGSIPSPDDQVYTQPIFIGSREGEPNDISMIPTNNDGNPGPPHYEGWQPPQGEVFKVNVVRAIAVKDGSIASEVSSATWLIDPLGSQRYSLPVFSLKTDRENFFDPEIGIYIPGNNNNMFQDGPEWERDVHIEFFETSGIPVLSQDVGVRLHGGTTRSRPRKSLRLYSRSDYGQSRMNYQFFPDKPINDFNRLLLRNSGNDWDWTVFRDGFLQHLAVDMNVDIQYYRPAIVFLNGEYWGIHNIRDRYDEDFIETHYGIPEQNMIMLDNNAGYNNGNYDGRQHYVNMVNFIRQNSMASEQNYHNVTTMMDANSFIDGQITNIFTMNTDWPGNNVTYWRHITDGYDPEAPAGLDGRWRWVLRDLDFGFGLPFHYVPGVDEGPAHNTLAMATDPNGPGWPNPEWSTLLLRRLLENIGFRNDFINRFADMLNTTFHQQNVLAVIDSIHGMLEPEMQEHIHRWRRPPSMEEWNENVEVLRDFARQRPVYSRQHLRQHFNLQDTLIVTLSVNDPQMGAVQINTIKVDAHPQWSGVYFRQIPLRIIAHPKPGYRLAQWQGISALPGDTLLFVPSGDVSITAIFEATDDFQGDEMNPPAHRLSQGQYLFNYWDPNQPEGSFPANMVFQQSQMADPALADPMTHPYHVPYLEYHDDDMGQGNLGFPYRLSRRSRINGLWADGISFINTGRDRDLGAAVLAIDTRDVPQVFVSWTGGTLQANSRVYAIRLQYRIGLEGQFNDLVDEQGNPVEYMRNETAGHSTYFQPVLLPSEVNDQPYVQLRWKFYFTGEQLSDESGARDMLRLDNIRVSASSTTSVSPHTGKSQGVLENFPNPFTESTNIRFELDSPDRVLLTILDQRGIVVARLLDEHLDAGDHQVTFQARSLPSGIYFYRLQTSSFSVSKRMVILR